MTIWMKMRLIICATVFILGTATEYLFPSTMPPVVFGLATAFGGFIGLTLLGRLARRFVESPTTD